MAAETIKEFLVGLGFKVDQAGLSKFASGLASASAKAMALGAAVTAAAGAIIVGVKNIAEGYDELDRLAETYRTTASEIDAFIDTAQILGVSNDAAKQSLKNLDAAIVDVSMGMGRAKLVFEELGIEVKNADGSLKSTTAVMGELVTVLDGVERGKRVRVLERLGLDPDTMRVFGKDFAGFNADLQQVAADLEAIDKSVGFDFDAAVKGSKEFMVSWREMGHEFEKWKMLFSKAMTSVAMKLLPAFREQMRRVTDSMVELRRRAMEHMPRVIDSILPIARAIMRVAEAFIRIVVRIAQGAVAIIAWIAKLNDATGGWLLIMGAVALAWTKLNLAFLATPLGMLIAAGIAIAALVDDFLTWKEGGESLIDWSGDLGDAMQAVIDVTIALGEAIIQGLGVARDWLAQFFTWCFEQWDAMKADWQATVAYLSGVGQNLIAAWQSVKDWFSGFFDLMSSGFARVASMASNIGGMVSNLAGKVKGIFGGAPSLPPGGGGTNVSQKTTINVTSSDPQAAGRAVARQQSRVNADMARNMKGAVR